jgi:hypothetical protein
MRQIVTVTLMVLSLLWQSVALARVGSTVNVLVDLEHAALHWQSTSHHHHDDGSYHEEDSAEATQHLMTDHLGASLEMAAGAAVVVPQGLGAAPAERPSLPWPSPPPDGLLRPPRL